VTVVFIAEQATVRFVKPGRTAVGTWSGGRFMHFGEPVSEERLASLLRPGDGIDTVITADVYGEGAADELLGRALEDVQRESCSIVGAIGHDFAEGERDGPRGFPRFTDARLRGPGDYGDYLRRATEASLSRVGIDAFDLLLLHNPDRTGFTSEAVWDGMAALAAAGLTGSIGVAPGPANGFTLDLIRCFERFGDRIDWAMVILNPLEPWPGELCLAAAAEHDVKVITRVVDYGGLFFDDVLPGHAFAQHDHRRFRPAGWVEAGRERLERMRPIAARHQLSTIQLACQWNLGHSAVETVAPTLIQESGESARPIEEKRADVASLPEQRLSGDDVAEIRAIGDNFGCMALKGASLDHEGEERADRWPVSDELLEAGRRWNVDADRDLRQVAPVA
jgi:aryl-alcohol dehydrogenase-like predicted oxidoreductase